MNYFPLLAFLIWSGLTGPLLGGDVPCIQIFYDQAPSEEPNRFFGRIHTLFIQNLMGHFPRWQQIIVPIQQYSKNQLDKCDANIYLGTYFKSEPPKPFLSDFVKTKRNVMWLGYHLWMLPEKDLAQLFGVSFKGLSSLGEDQSFFKYYHYKGEVFEKYGEWDAKDPRKFNAAFELVVLEQSESPPPESHIISWAEHSKSHNKIPYLVVNQNHWYMAESPFAFATEKDRYLIFTDLLFDFLNEAPRRVGNRPAFVRFEDIHPNLPLWQLETYTHIFETAGIPFSISLIPIFADPLMVQVDDKAERFVTIAQRTYFKEFLRRAETKRASIILHGITHQYQSIKNPFNGLSGDDFEFWDGVNQKPIPEDSADYVLSRLELGWQLTKSSEFTPVAWLTPHYQASPLDFILFGQLFHWNIGRVVYFPHHHNQDSRLPEELTFESSDTLNHEARLKLLNSITVRFPSGLKPSGQFFPYEIWGDVYGQRLVPENLGNVQPFLNEQVHKTQSISEMLSCAKRNRVLRDHWASLFIHPVLVLPRSEEGLGDYPGDGNQVQSFLRDIQTLGYEFIHLKDWTSHEPLLMRPPPKDLSYESFD